MQEKEIFSRPVTRAFLKNALNSFFLTVYAQDMYFSARSEKDGCRY